MTISIDALPYYDRELDTSPGLGQRLERLVETELASNPPPVNKTHPRVPSFESKCSQSDTYSSSPLLQQSLERVSASYPARPPALPANEGFDESRYAVPTSLPPPSDSPQTLEAYEEALKTFELVSAHRRTQISNLELLQKYGPNTWRINNFITEKDISRMEDDANRLKSEIENIHRSRKSMHTEAGNTLRTLENKWTSLISNNMQLEIVNFALERELTSLRSRASEVQAQLGAQDS